MDLRKAINFVRQECLSYQLPNDKQYFDDKKGEVLDFLENDVNEKRFRRTIEIEVLASNMKVIDEMAKDIEEMNGRSFNKGKICIKRLDITDE